MVLKLIIWTKYVANFITASKIDDEIKSPLCKLSFPKEVSFEPVKPVTLVKLDY